MSTNDSILECPAPFVHGWASVNPNIYPYEVPDFCKPAPLPPSVPTSISLPIKKPRTPNLFLPKSKIVKSKPTLIDKTTISTTPTNARTDDKTSENVLTVESESRNDVNANGHDVGDDDNDDDDDPWGLGTSSKKTEKVSTTVSTTDNNEAPGEDAGAFAPLPPPLTDPFQSTAAEPEQVRFENVLHLDLNLLETIVRSVLISKILLDSRREHQKTVSILNAYKSDTAGLHPDHAQLYETYLSQAVGNVEKVQLRLNGSLKFIDEDIKSQIQEFTIKHDQMLISPDPTNWGPKPVQKCQNSSNTKAAPVGQDSDWGSSVKPVDHAPIDQNSGWGSNDKPESNRRAPNTDWGADIGVAGANSMTTKSDWGADTGAGGNSSSGWGSTSKNKRETPSINQTSDWGTNTGAGSNPVNGSSDWGSSNNTEGNGFNKNSDWGTSGETGGQNAGRGSINGTGTNAGAQDSGWGSKSGRGGRGGNQNSSWGLNGGGGGWGSGGGESGGGGGGASWSTGGGEGGGGGFGSSGQQGARGFGGRGKGRDGFENDFSQSSKRGRFGESGGNHGSLCDRGSVRGHGRGRGRGRGGDKGSGSSWSNSNNNDVSESTNFGWGGDDKSVSQKPANNTVASGWGGDDKVKSHPVNEKDPDAAKAAPTPVAEAFDWGDWA